MSNKSKPVYPLVIPANSGWYVVKFYEVEVGKATKEKIDELHLDDIHLIPIIGWDLSRNEPLPLCLTAYNYLEDNTNFKCLLSPNGRVYCPYVDDYDNLESWFDERKAEAIRHLTLFTS